MNKISEIVNYYTTQSYDGTEVEDDENWDTDDLISLRDAIDIELCGRLDTTERDIHVVPSMPKLAFIPWTSQKCH